MYCSNEFQLKFWLIFLKLNYIYDYELFVLMCDRDHHIVKQLYSNKKKLEKIILTLIQLKE